MNRTLSAIITAGILACAGCGGGGGGASSVPDTSNVFINHNYEGVGNDSRYGAVKLVIDVDRLTKYSGTVSPSMTFFAYDTNPKQESDPHLFNHYVGSGPTDQQYYVDHANATYANGAFTAPMATWPENTPANNRDAAIFHVAIQGQVNHDLTPGSTVTVKYSSTNCSFISSGVVKAQYVSTTVYSGY